MAIVRNDSIHIVDITGGRTLTPGEQANIDASAPHETALIAEGILTVIDPDVDPPPPPPAGDYLFGLISGAGRGSVLYHDGSTWRLLSPGTSGRVLTTRGSGAAPEWARVDVPDLDFDVATQTELDAALLEHADPDVTVTRDTFGEISSVAEGDITYDNFVRVAGKLVSYDRDGVTRTINRDGLGRITGVS